MPSVAIPGVGVVKYPEQLGTAPWEKWILFEVRSGRHIARDGFVGESSATPDRTVASVALYLPTDALKSSMAIGYKDISMGAAAGQAIEGMFQKGGQGATAATVGAGGGILDKLKSAGSGVAGFAVGLAQQSGYDGLSGIASAVGADPDTIGALAGGAVNPRTDSVFDAVSYRTHDFDFSLIPRSKTEANSIDVILNILHFYSLPSYGAAGAGNFFIGYPYEFVITLFTQVTGGGHHINTIERSVLTNLSVDHAGGDRVAFVDDRGGVEYYPAATRMSLSFKETRLLGRDVNPNTGRGVIFRGKNGAKPDYLDDAKGDNSAANAILLGVGTVAVGVKVIKAAADIGKANAGL